MKIKTSLMVALVFIVLTIPAVAGKKKHAQRGMLEKMEAVPCGARQKGVNGLGSLWASVGVEHVTSDEKLCPQYLFRTDDMEYHIRPLDKKHPVILPIGHEGEYKIDKDRMFLKVPDGDRKKRAYQVVAMKPLNAEGDNDKSAEAPRER
jgi:hypothetical protein